MNTKRSEAMKASWAKRRAAAYYKLPEVDNFHAIADYLLRTTNDPVDHPSHYTSHPSGVECIQITEHLNFCVGNAIKYLFRAGKKGDYIEDLKKAKWYIEREIARVGE